MIKIVVSDPKSGRSKGIELSEERAVAFVGRHVGEQIDGSAVEMPGYKFRISGGSDTSGFPLDRSIQGSGKMKLLRPIGGSKNKGTYERKTVRGGVISADTAQVNVVVTEYGAAADSFFGAPKAGDKAEKAEKPEKGA